MKSFRSCAMLCALVVSLFAALPASAACPPAMVTVADTLYDQNGDLLNGTVFITNPLAFTSPDGCAVAQNQRTFVTVTNGAFTTHLVPNTGSTPSGTSYQVDYTLAGGVKYSEVWVVPASGPTNVASVRASIPPSPSMVLAISQLAPPKPCVAGQTLFWSGTAWNCNTVSGSGTVTSVALALPNIFSIAGSPITGAGTLTGTLANQNANRLWAGPASGVPGLPSFRALVSADIPDNAANTSGTAASVSGIVPIASGGLNNSATPSDGQVPIYDVGTAKYIPGDPIVSGPDAPGVAPTRNPVQSGAFDGTNVQRVSSDTSGKLNVNISNAPSVSVSNFPATQPVSGTFFQVTQPVSGTFWQATQPVSIATMPSTPVTGTFWQATQPVSIATMPSTPVTGTFFQGTQPVSIADGSNTTLGSKADAKSTATDITAVTAMQVLKEISAMEQAPASRAVTNAGTFAAQAAQSGTWTVQPGNTANTTAWKVDGSAVTQPVSGAFFQATQPVSGTFWQATQPISAASLPLPSGAALDASVTGLQVSQGSTTSGQKGSIAQGAVTTGAPTYTTAQTSPLSLTPAGALRVDNSAVTQPVSGTVAGTQSGTWTVQPGNTANTTAWKVDGSAVTQPVSGTVTTTPPSNASTNVAQINAVTPLMGNGITGTGSQRVTIASDNTAFAVNNTQQGTASQNVAQVNGVTTLTGTGASGTGSQRVSVANDSQVKPWDGTNTVTVKAASTAAAAADTSEVVQLSPNGLNPCWNPTATLVGNTTAMSGTTATQVVALSGSTKIYICSLSFGIGSGTTPVLTLNYGTGTACATGTTAIINAAPILPSSATVQSFTSFNPPFFVTPAGQALCYTLTGTTPTGKLIFTYVQQ